MDDLIAFFRARVEEGETHANAIGHDVNVLDEFYSCAAGRTEPLGDLEWGENATCDCFAAERKARALREVEGDRLLIEAYEDRASWVHDFRDPDSDYENVTEAEICWEEGAAEALLAAIRFRVLAWSGHPDYKESWRP